jgi:hypothetical protein
MARNGEYCPECSDLGPKCVICSVSAPITQLLGSLQNMMQNQPEKLIYKVAAEMETEKVIAKHDKGKEIIKTLRELAKKYSQLEFQNQRAVRTIRSYGKAWKEAAEDFMEDGDQGQLLLELNAIEETKAFFLAANKTHTEIK